MADKKVDTHARHADGGQKRTVNKHQYQIEASYKRIQNRLSQLARQKIRHVIIVLHPLGEVSGIALVKKRNRQPEHAVEKFMGRYQCHFGLESDQHQSAVPGKQTLEKDCSCHSDQQCAQPVGATAQQDIVDKYLGVDRSHKPRHHQQQPGSDESRHSDTLSFEPLPDKARKRSNTFLLAEILTRFKNQHDPGERVIQILQSQLAASYGRVVDVRTTALKALKNHKMVEIPVDDGRRSDPAQVFNAFGVALADHAELSGGPKDVAGVAAVPGNTGLNAHLLQRHKTAVIAQHHGKRRGAAFRGFHLVNGGRLDPAAPEPYFFLFLFLFTFLRGSAYKSFFAFLSFTRKMLPDSFGLFPFFQLCHH